MLFREKINGMMNMFYDEIQTMRENENDIIMDFGIEIDEEENLPEE